VKRFRYSALSGAGDLVTGELVAADQQFVLARLHEQALLPIEANEVGTQAAASFGWLGRGGGPLPTRDLALISQQLARLLKAGLPLDRALSILIEQAEGKRTTQALRQTLNRVRDGGGLAEAFASQGKTFPESFVTLVRAGEASGALQGVLAETATFLVRAEAMRQKIASAMIYPVILVVAASLSVGLILTTVLPQFEPMFKEAGAKLPLSTQIVVAAGHGLRDDWWVLLAAMALAVLAGRSILRNPAALLERDRMLLATPLFGSLVSRFEIGRFCRTLGVMLASGVAAPAAMSMSGATIGNRVLADAVELTAARFKEGEGLSAPLARTGRFPNLAIQLIRTGEETGRLEEMLGEVATIFDQEVQRALERLLALLVPALTMVMGLVVAFIVAAVMLALLTVNSLAV
jgi:general secretion pathway protein F